MATNEQFLQRVKEGYTFKGETLKIGRALLNGQVVEGADVLLPLRTMNRHGLIA
ncbi:MAG: ATPase, partial [Chitinophagaceae bacterium]